MITLPMPPRNENALDDKGRNHHESEDGVWNQPFAPKVEIGQLHRLIDNFRIHNHITSLNTTAVNYSSSEAARNSPSQQPPLPTSMPS